MRRHLAALTDEPIQLSLSRDRIRGTRRAIWDYIRSRAATPPAELVELADDWRFVDDSVNGNGVAEGRPGDGV
jgi:hypothetical protein